MKAAAPNDLSTITAEQILNDLAINVLRLNYFNIIFIDFDYFSYSQ